MEDEKNRQDPSGDTGPRPSRDYRDPAPRDNQGRPVGPSSPPHPNVPKEGGDQPNPANIGGKRLPPEQQAPKPEDPKEVGTGSTPPKSP